MNKNSGPPLYHQILFAFVILKDAGYCQQFDQLYTGVSFDPYVKLPIVGTDFPSWREYTVNESQAMLEIIAEKFSKVVTQGAGSKNDTYIWNVTYYNDSYIEARTSEIAATINCQSGNTRITVLQGIRLFKKPRAHVEIQLAIECAEKANQIHSGTVEGIYISYTDTATNYTTAKQALNDLQILQNSSVAHLKLGARMECYRIFNKYSNDDHPEENLKVLHAILKNSNFVVCDIDPPFDHLSQGGAVAFELITQHLLDFRQQLQSINPQIEVMALIGWSSAEVNSWESVKNLRIYWETANQWAAYNKFPIWFFEAFDNPWRYNYNDKNKAHYGWWKLTDNSKSDTKEGYIEKISEEETDSSNPNTRSAVLILVGLLVLLVFILGIAFLVMRRRKMYR